MQVTMQDICAWLDAEEVDYVRASQLGPDALPLLRELIQGADPALASKSTYLVSLIRSEESVAALETAATSQELVVRVAAAAALRNLPEVQAERVLDRLSDDSDAGVRKVLLKSASKFRSPEIEAKLQRMAETAPESFIRELATSTVDIMRQRRQAP